MRADNDGEGGILALTTLAARAVADVPTGGAPGLLVLIGLFGAALLYGDGVITPVDLGAGRRRGHDPGPPSSNAWSCRWPCVVLLGLFSVQSQGTAAIGRVFGPVMIVWFTGDRRARRVARRPAAPGASRPSNPVHGVHVLRSTTGSTASWCSGPSSSSWWAARPSTPTWATSAGGRSPSAGTASCCPAWCSSTSARARCCSRSPARSRTPSSGWRPSGRSCPLVVLATMATVIASQALISGAFSLTSQAIQLGYVPRLRVQAHLGARRSARSTSPRSTGSLFACACCSWSASASRRTWPPPTAWRSPPPW